MFVQSEQLAAGPRRHLVAAHGTHAAHVLAELGELAQSAKVAPEEGGVDAVSLEVGGAKEVQPAQATCAHTRGKFVCPASCLHPRAVSQFTVCTLASTQLNGDYEVLIHQKLKYTQIAHLF